MQSDNPVTIREDRRSEPRTMADRYHNVEFSFTKFDPIYQFRLRDTSPSGFGILVKDDSSVLRNLEVGDVLTMKYNPAEPSAPSMYVKTEIMHMTPIEDGSYRGNYLIGLRVLERIEPEKP